MEKKREKKELESRPGKKKPYEEPKVMASYKKEELQDAIELHGGGGCGSGCGCGCS